MSLRTAEPSRFATADEEAQAAHTALRDFILAASFPCLGARAAMRRGTYRFHMYERLGTCQAARELHANLVAFATQRAAWDTAYATYIACFRHPKHLDEETFEQLLWRQLQDLHDVDAPQHAWDERVSSDPSDPRFSFSVGGEAFFVVGLNPGSWRDARRFSWPVLCFNPHEQFEALRDSGAYERLRDRIRGRDRALQGTDNPMLEDHGARSEAAQYSGRLSGTQWQCPLQLRTHS